MKTPFLHKAPRRLAILLSPLAILLTIVWTSSAAETVPAPLQKAALAGTWKDVISLAGDLEKEDASYPARLIKGHACLAMNRCNESAALFFTRGTPENVASYLEWTTSVVGANPQSALAHYFNGDALARQQKWEESLKEFDAAVQIDPDLALAYNARGIVHAMRKEIRPARADFQKAAQVNGDKLADAFSNAGYLWIQQMDGAKGALEEFQKALAVCPSFALAEHGKGCIERLLNNTDDANRDLTAAYDNSNILMEAFRRNDIRYAAYSAKSDPQQLLAEAGNPGMSIRARATTDQSLMNATKNLAYAKALKDGPNFPGRDQIAAVSTALGHNNLNDAYATGGTAAMAKFNNLSPELHNIATQQTKPINLEATKICVDAVADSHASLTGTMTSLAKTATTLTANVAQNIVAKTQLMDPLVQKALSAPAGTSSTYNPSGVRTKVKLRSRNWPFLPLYGLAYSVTE